MNKGLVLDVINFGINNKLLFIFCESDKMEKIFLYPPKNKDILEDQYNRLDYAIIIEYEYHDKGKKIYYEIIEENHKIKKNLKKLILTSIICDLIKNSLQVDEKASFFYNNVVDYLKIIVEENDIEKNFMYSYIILFLFYLLSASGVFSLPDKDYYKKVSETHNLFYDIKNTNFIFSKSNLNIEKGYLKCTKDLIILYDFYLKNDFITRQNLQKLENTGIEKLNNLLFFLSNLFNLSYHRNRINSLSFINYIN